MKKKRPWYTYPYLLWMLVFIVVPIILVLWFALTKDGAFSLDNMRKALMPENLKMLWRSLLLAVECTVLCLLLGYPLALVMSKIKDRYRIIAYVLLILPMWMNFLLRTYAWMSLIENTGFINTFLMNIGLIDSPLPLMYNDTAIVIAMVYDFLPFMVLPIYNVIIKIDNRLIEAAHDLGANSYKTFSKLILPMTIPGVISGVTMVFMPAITTFVIPQLIGGGKTMLIGNLIEQQFLVNYDYSFGSALAVFMMILVFISMTLLNKFDKNQESGGVI